MLKKWFRFITNPDYLIYVEIVKKLLKYYMMKFLSVLYQMCEKRSVIISNNSNNSYSSMDKSKVSNDYIIFYTYKDINGNCDIIGRCYGFKCKGHTRETGHLL
jgi:hypothetical protein